jgi:uncharacterized NAD(P)/FAD-binding protein YdhS
MHVADVAIVGGGAAGVLLTAHLARAARRPMRITIVDAGPGRLGAGIAYRTTDPGHLLNVRTANLSAWAGEPDHFVSWLARRGTPALPSDYVTRTAYGAYLAAVADDAGNGRYAHVRHVRSRAVDADPTDRGWAIRLSDGVTITAADLVLAIGTGAPAPLPGAAHRPRYVADPWRPGAFDAIDADDPVLVIGTGLTAIDVVTTLARDGRRLTAVSRHGLLPAEHRRVATAPMPYEPGADDLASLRRRMRVRIAASIARTGDWRPAVDGVRPHAQRIWRALSDHDRREFLRRDRRRWEVARHRMAPRVAAAIAELRASGRLTITTGDATTAIANAPAGTWIVNATGADGDLRRSPDPLPRALFRAGHAVPGPYAIGFATTDPGQLLDRDGDRVHGLWTLGGTRRGDLWESTAIPEIRDQAQALAVRLADAPALATRG